METELKMNQLEILQQQRNRFGSIVSVIGDNNAVEQLSNINHDYNMVQRCTCLAREYRHTHTSKTEQVIIRQITDFKQGKKIVMRG